MYFFLMKKKQSLVSGYIKNLSTINTCLSYCHVEAKHQIVFQMAEDEQKRDK